MYYKRIFSIVLSLLLIFSVAISPLALSVNLDSKEGMTLGDVQALLLHIAGIKPLDESVQGASDIDHNGYITSDDARLLLRAVSGIDILPEHCDFSDWEVVEAPTCTQWGYAESFCGLCGAYFEKALPPTGHAETTATCTEDGYCISCGEFAPAAGHNFVDNICTRCGFEKTIPTIRYLNKKLEFNSTPDALIKALGKPTEILTDNASEKNVSVYIYSADYTKLGIFTFMGDKLKEFYTNHPGSGVSHQKESYILNGDEKDTDTIGEITVTEYLDKKAESGAYIYAFSAYIDTNYTLYDTTDYTVSEKLILHTTNGCRAINGLSTLKYSEKMHKTAYAHSLDMATRNYFSHYTPENKNIENRLNDNNIKYRAYGENIAGNISSVYRATDGWYNSTDHRNCMLYDFEYLGVGIAYNQYSKYKFYITQNYYTPF